MFDMLVELGTQINTKSLLYRSVNWIGEGPHMILLEELIRSGFDVSEIEAPSFAMWPLPCSPDWLALDRTPDPFFVDWISKNLENCPGFAGMNPLLEAILTGSSEKVKRLATKELLVKDQDNLLGQSALHLAVFRPQHLEILLEAGADVNSRDRHGTTPLMYAVAMGRSPVAIRLLDMGADPYLKDHHLKGNFLVYARERRHWPTVVDVLRHIHEDSKIPKRASRSWSTLAAILLVNDGPIRYKDVGHFRALLDIGADANIVYQTGDCDLSTRTLAHGIWDKACLEALISHGFRSFNHQDGDGAHALISFSRKGHSQDPGIMKLLLQQGSLVNHQDKNGHTSLHVVTQQLHSGLRLNGSEQSDIDWECNKRTDVLHSIRVLLDNEADPFLGDKCDCACSGGESGCTPSHLALRGTFDAYHNDREDIWILEYVDIVRKVKGHKAAEQCLLDVLRLVKFHELELTHTCHRHHDYNFLDERHIEEDEIKEIHDEEKELIDELEKEMQGIERTPPIDFDPELLGAIFQHSLTMKKNYTPLDISVSNGHHYEVDSWRDEFVWQRPEAPPLDRAIRARESETVDTITYAAWVEHEHLKHQEGIVDNEWYEKRIGWIATLRGMNKTVNEERKLFDVK
ncbi:ankyrin repeat-containing domain protein, partial [Leptodontidium sp. 2 PMI_412]